MMLRLEDGHNWINREEYSEMFMYYAVPYTFLRVDTLDELQKVLKLIDKHDCRITSFGYLAYIKGFYVEIEKDNSCNNDKKEKVIVEDNEEPLIAIAIRSLGGNVPDMFNIVRGNRCKVIETIAKYFKEIANEKDIYWKTEIPLKTFDRDDWAGEIKPTEKISSSTHNYCVKVKKIEEGSFIPFTLSTPDWVTFSWTGKDMEYFHSLL